MGYNKEFEKELEFKKSNVDSRKLELISNSPYDLSIDEMQLLLPHSGHPETVGEEVVQKFSKDG